MEWAGCNPPGHCQLPRQRVAELPRGHVLYGAVVEVVTEYLMLLEIRNCIQLQIPICISLVLEELLLCEGGKDRLFT